MRLERDSRMFRLYFGQPTTRYGEALAHLVRKCANVPPGGFATRQEDYECMVIRERGIPPAYKNLKHWESPPWDALQ